MEATTRVCPNCGNPPGAGVFCESCGRNLSAVERLPTRAEWERDHAVAAEPPSPQRSAAAVAAFLEAMRAAGNPGTTKIPIAGSGFRTRHVEAWIVRPVEREDFERPRTYESGLALTPEGDFYTLDSELRGWGQRDFPHYHHTVQPDPVPAPVDDRLPGELAEVLKVNDLAPTG
jgi:hypothetical protein